MPNAITGDTRAEKVAKAMFEAYNAAGPNPGKTHDGKDVPPWDSVGAQVKAKWVAVADWVLTGGEKKVP